MGEGADDVERLTRRERTAPNDWTNLLLGRQSVVEISGGSKPPSALFPGAYNPLHEGHREIARIAAERLGQPVTFELSITNVDKPPLDFIEIDDRLQQFGDAPVWLTRTPTFVEKAALAPGCVFVVGADTIARIAQPSYYGEDAAARDTAVASLAENRCRFLVFGREFDGQFQTLDDLELPTPLRHLCDGISEDEFRADISSTELRAG